ncbi:MAG: hydrogenase maturation protease [Dehalococcoidales bacterium]|nr:hydrogenase maturation protease [Dehalococcoidales bacterium]
MKTLVLGLGNPYICDDSAGLKVIKLLEKRLSNPDVTLNETSLAGINLLDYLVGYDKAIIVDAIQSPNGKPGSIYRLTPEEFDTTCHTTSSHDIGVIAAIELGKRLELSMPKIIEIVGIEAGDVSTLTEECTPDVDAAIPIAVDMIVKEVQVTHVRRCFLSFLD